MRGWLWERIFLGNILGMNTFRRSGLKKKKKAELGREVELNATPGKASADLGNFRTENVL